MPTTNQAMIDRARIHHLNDSEKTTWQDSELFAHLIHGLRLLRGRRPDLYFGLTVDLDALLAEDDFPLEEIYVPALEDYIVARAQFKEDEYALQGAATAFYSLFKEGLS